MYMVQGDELRRYVPGTRGGVGAVCTWYTAPQLIPAQRVSTFI